MRRAARRDDNENEIVLFLRECGAYVKPVNHAGLFDLLVYYNGHTLLFEVKDGSKSASARELSPAEQKFHAEWPGNNLFIVASVEDAVEVLKKCV
jgi:hypothetical protein